MNATATPRAKPLNANTLTALPVGIEVWNEEIAYLDNALTRQDHAVAADSTLRAKFTLKRDTLIRCRDWLQSKLDSELADREPQP